MNESGSRSATEGVRNGVNNVSPSLTIPGHIQELGHFYEPTNPTSRVPYEWPLAVDDVPIPGELKVMAWGEYVDYGVAAVDATPTARLFPSGDFTTADQNNDGLGDVAASVRFAYVGEVHQGAGRIDRQIAKFDLPNLSQNEATVKSAKLRFYLEDIVGIPAGPASLWHSVEDNSLVKVGTQFEDSTYGDTLIDVFQPTDATGQYYEVDVTDQVLADYAAEGRAIAFSAFRLQINEAVLFENGESRFYELSPPIGGDHPPQLVITFIPEPTTLTTALFAFFTLLSTSRRNRW
jgi:hypothetical protein